MSTKTMGTGPMWPGLSYLFGVLSMERIFQSINYMEAHMYEPISVHDIAKASYYSTYHFCRIFRSIVGDAPKEYLRKRRLTVAADRLLKEKVPIVDLALDCQFDSQEAFTRSFKQLFKMTPGQYRKKGDPFRLIYKDQFSPHMLYHLQNRLNMAPEIVARQEIKMVGIASQYKEDDLNLKTLWSAFKPMESLITNRVNTDCCGIYEEYTEEGDSVGFTYVCAVEVSKFENVPKGMITRILPAHLYAVFQHKGPMSFLPETLKYIWGSWLPKSNYNYVEKPDFEIYPEGSKADPKSSKAEDPNNIVYLYIPVSEK